MMSMMVQILIHQTMRMQRCVMTHLFVKISSNNHINQVLYYNINSSYSPMLKPYFCVLFSLLRYCPAWICSWLRQLLSGSSFLGNPLVSVIVIFDEVFELPCGCLPFPYSCQYEVFQGCIIVKELVWIATRHFNLMLLLMGGSYCCMQMATLIVILLAKSLVAFNCLDM